MPLREIVTRVVVYRGEDTNWWWRAKSGTTRIVYESSYSFTTKEAAIENAKSVYPTLTPEVQE